jgi:hypothetical protein
MRREAAKFLDSLRDPFGKPQEENPNNYDEIKEIKTTMQKTITIDMSTRRRAFVSVPKIRG